jgi:hypothetical protein
MYSLRKIFIARKITLPSLSRWQNWLLFYFKVILYTRKVLHICQRIFDQLSTLIISDNRNRKFGSTETDVIYLARVGTIQFTLTAYKDVGMSVEEGTTQSICPPALDSWKTSEF